MIFESHAHYDDEKFDSDRVELLSVMREHNIETIVNIGASFKGAQDSIALAEQFEDVYAAIGIHPENTEDLTDENFAWVEANAGHEKVVAIGEIGLDYYWIKDPDTQKLQRESLIKQLEIASRVKLPVVIHSRDAAEDTLAIMKDYQDLDGVIHCFSYSRELAREYVKMGFYIGVGGVVTFKNGRKMVEVVEDTPMDRILLETDSPYLTPEPNRGKRNDYNNLIYIAAKIAEIKGLSTEEVIEATRDNARRMYYKVR